MKTTTIKILCFALLVGTFSYCKKEKVSNPEQTTNTISPVETPPSRIDGYVSFHLNFSIKYDSTRFQHGQLFGSFYNKPKHIDSLPLYLISDDVGDITLNGINVPRLNNSTGLIYNYAPNNDLESQRFLNERSWHLKGNNTFNETKFIDKTRIPEYLSNVGLPDTIYKYKDNVLKFGTLSQVDTAFVKIILSDPIGISAFKILDISKKKLVFSKEDFYFLISDNQFSFAEIEISIFKQGYQVVGGKAFRYGYNIIYRSDPIPFKAYEIE